MSDPQRAVIYARQSISRDPSDSLSIDFQIEECKRYIAARGWTLVGTYADPDRKGWRRYRPAFDEMLGVIDGGNADTVVLFKLSRFARDLRMQEDVVTEIANAGGELVSITEPHMNTSPMIRQILGAVNENYRRDQSDWLKSTFAARARRGKHHGYAPFGYRKVDKALEIDEHSGYVARQVWDWALEGHGTPEITFRLNEQGVLTQRGQQWTPIAVLGILRNPVYAGNIMHRGEIVARDVHPAIVTDDEFQTVQETINRRSHHRRKADPSWAEGFVYHACGERMYLAGWNRGGEQRPRFRCHKAFARRQRGDIPCTRRPASMYASFVEERIVAALIPLAGRLVPPERVAAALEASYGATTKQRERQRSGIERRRDDLKRQRDRLLDLVLQERIDADLYTERDNALKMDIAALQIELDTVPPPVDIDEVRDRHRHLAELTSTIRTVANEYPGELVPVLSALGARLILGDGEPRLILGDELAPYFDGV